MAESPDTPRTQRLFFALWPDDETREQVHRLARHWVHKSGRPMAKRNLHITLAFIGSAPAELRDCLLDAAAAVTAPAFDLSLDRVGIWARPRIQWLAPSAPPAELMLLVECLNRALAPCGWVPETRPFLAHITLARKVSSRRPAETVKPVLWPVRDFVLVESVTDANGARYEVLARWPLG